MLHSRAAATPSLLLSPDQALPGLRPAAALAEGGGQLAAACQARGLRRLGLAGCGLLVVIVRVQLQGCSLDCAGV